ncbi:hypothetical protein GCM10011490_03910 [Pseudoclavibacter endophyticus]|uniref:PH domain-containing protein n=1 Tax=Pseudoclavibacter endophyticus TaxID=1778590 RepID=A0A6H9WGK9_9MICO|nr:hypothetical protein [Pseudoclavibacter endophyticus]KAB1650089.1 hypothetical protein F8O04_07760 [Pseudoclavibacter endophyticus]GGA57367.1 hypothetical protein GCM10011490_03910 [Pseudoclavibacter endophyticus]
MSDLDARWLIGAAILAVFVLLLFALRAGWRAKGRAQADICPPPPGDAVGGRLVERLDDVHYVATTLDGRPLERIVHAPLAFRGRCLLEVLVDGVRVTIRGIESFAIPRSSIVAVGARTATIDRVVERDGLTTVSWRLATAEGGARASAPPVAAADADAESIVVHTSFRVVDSAERDRLEAALATLRPATTPSNEESR